MDLFVHSIATGPFGGLPLSGGGGFFGSYFSEVPMLTELELNNDLGHNVSMIEL